MNKKVSLEEGFLSKFSGITDVFHINRAPDKDLDSEFKKSEKRIHDKSSGSVTPKVVKYSDLVVKLTVWNYNNTIKGSAASYIGDLDSTKGNYNNRDSRIKSSVYSMRDLIKKNYKTSNVYGLFDLYLRLFDVVTDKKWSDTFSIAFNLSQKGSEAAKVIYIEYVLQVYVLEYLTIIFSKYLKELNDSSSYSSANTEICKIHSSFVTAACKNVINILVKCENIKDPKKYITDLAKVEKDTSTDKGVESLDDGKFSLEDGGIITMSLVIGAISIMTVIAAVGVFRTIIYSLACARVDLSKSLVEQSYMLLINIEALEEKLSNLKEGTREYDEMRKIIEKQKKYTATLMAIVNKIADSDVESIDEIRAREKDDNETIIETLDNDDDYGDSSTKFDI